ncbi:MAG: Ig-like domain-containing protein, partial [bacterium]
MAPQLVVKTSDSALRAGETATLELLFTELPAEIPALSVSMGSLGAMVADATNPLRHTIQLTPPDDLSSGSIGLSVGAWTDAAGNAGTVLLPSPIAVDTRAPSVISVVDDVPGVANSATGAVTFTLK